MYIVLSLYPSLSLSLSDKFTEIFGSFKMANVWNDVTTVTSKQNEEVEQNERNDDAYWIKVLEERYKHYISQKTEHLGRGKRSRKRIEYENNDVFLCLICSSKHTNTIP
jgi:hypothetical protein